MNTKEAEETEQKTLKESSLSDLPVADEQEDSTKGGAGLNGNLQISTFICPSDSR